MFTPDELKILYFHPNVHIVSYKICVKVIFINNRIT